MFPLPTFPIPARSSAAGNVDILLQSERAMTIRTWTDDRRNRRHTVAQPELFDVTIDIEGVGSVSVSCFDLSNCGCRIATESRIPNGTRVKIRMKSEVGSDYSSMATVRWVAPRQGEGWMTGLSLDEPLPVKFVQKLAEQNVVDRRQDERKPVDIDVQLRSELGSESTTAAKLVDYSMSGFRVELDQPIAEPGSRLMMQLPKRNGEEKTVLGKVAWVAPANGAYSIGCGFVSQNDHATLSATVDPESRRRWLDFVRPRTTHWRSIAAIVSLLLTYQLIAVARDNPGLVYQVDQTLREQVGPLLQKISETFSST